MNKYKVRQRSYYGCANRIARVEGVLANLVIQFDDEPLNIGETAVYSVSHAKWLFPSTSLGTEPTIDDSIARGLVEVLEKTRCASVSYYVATDRLGTEEVWYLSIAFIHADGRVLRTDGQRYMASFGEITRRFLQEAIDRNLQE